MGLVFAEGVQRHEQVRACVTEGQSYTRGARWPLTSALLRVFWGQDSVSDSHPKPTVSTTQGGT